MRMAAKNSLGSRKKSKARGKAKVPIVMREFERGTLRSGRSNKNVTSRKQAVAIAMSEAGLSKK